MPDGRLVKVLFAEQHSSHLHFRCLDHRIPLIDPLMFGSGHNIHASCLIQRHRRCQAQFDRLPSRREKAHISPDCPFTFRVQEKPGLRMRRTCLHVDLGELTGTRKVVEETRTIHSERGNGSSLGFDENLADRASLHSYLLPDT